MGLFDGKKGLILGVANENSIAWAIAKQIMAEGGCVGSPTCRIGRTTSGSGTAAACRS